MGFNFFSNRSQAIRMIKYQNFGFNLRKAEKEKMMGGLHIEYFMEPFAIFGNTSLKLKHIKTFSKFDSKGLEIPHVAKSIK